MNHLPSPALKLLATGVSDLFVGVPQLGRVGAKLLFNRVETCGH